MLVLLKSRQSWRILFGAPFKVKSVRNLVMWINHSIVACLSLLNNNTIVDGRVDALIAVKISFWTDWRQNWRYFFSTLDLHEKYDEVILMGRVIYNGIYTKYLNLNLNRRRSMEGLSITKILLKERLGWINFTCKRTMFWSLIVLIFLSVILV